MKTVMRKCGFDAELYIKPQDYETFRDQVRSAKSVVVLVSAMMTILTGKRRVVIM